jgi:hypothetical protein
LLPSVGPQLRAVSVPGPRAPGSVSRRLASYGESGCGSDTGDELVDALLVDILIEIIEVAVELEQTVELRHEVARYGAACCGQRTGTTLAPGEHTIEGGCLASNPAAIRFQGSPWRRYSRCSAK